MQSVICSAPGKVLITGGYLVLFRPFSGLVLTVNARFSTSICSIEKNDPIIEVESPQFLRQESFRVSLPELLLNPINDDHEYNPYTENTILISLIAIQQIIGKDKFAQIMKTGIHITIQGDNAFYSQRDQLIARSLPLTSASLATLPRFMKTISNNKESLSNMKKTGLGSSAALVTSLVAALYSFFGAGSIPSLTSRKQLSSEESNNLKFVHNLAQYCHCVAQKKIGSGFDVSSAVYGSQRYVRFTDTLLRPLLENNIPSGQEIIKIMNSPDWNNQCDPFALPRGMTLLLGDVSKGSNTPNMVSKVLAWKSSHESENIIQSLAKLNSMTEDYFRQIHDLENSLGYEAYDKYLLECACTSSHEWSNLQANLLAPLLVQLRKTFLGVRSHLREIGHLAEVDIEPPSQQELNDLTMEITGVLIAGVPGAGGYDAIFAILLKPTVSQVVEEAWIKQGVLPLMLSEQPIGVCRE